MADIRRSFALTPERAGLTATPALPAARRLEEPAHPHERTLGRESRKPVEVYERVPWYERQMHALRWMTAIAAMLFVFFVSVDVLGNIDTGGDDDDMAADTNMAAEMAPAAAPAEATATTSSGASVLMATVEPDDSARNAEATNTPANVSGGSEPTAATGTSQPTPATAGGSAAEEASTPASADDTQSATTEGGDEAMTMLTPNETEQADTTGQAQQQDGNFQSYSGNATAEESRESDTLHLIELALAITLAWLIVAMIALPRLRRPSG